MDLCLTFLITVFFPRSFSWFQTSPNCSTWPQQAAGWSHLNTDTLTHSISPLHPHQTRQMISLEIDASFLFFFCSFLHSKDWKHTDSVCVCVLYLLCQNEYAIFLQRCTCCQQHNPLFPDQQLKITYIIYIISYQWLIFQRWGSQCMKAAEPVQLCGTQAGHIRYFLPSCCFCFLDSVTSCLYFLCSGGQIQCQSCLLSSPIHIWSVRELDCPSQQPVEGDLLQRDTETVCRPMRECFILLKAAFVLRHNRTLCYFIVFFISCWRGKTEPCVLCLPIDPTRVLSAGYSKKSMCSLSWERLRRPGVKADLIKDIGNKFFI